MDVQTFKAMFQSKAKTFMVFEVLEDKKWHCRQCEYDHVGTTQIAGSGGIQGLQKGSTKRPGIEIESETHFCMKCGETTYQDKWTGDFVSAVASHGMPDALVYRVLQYFKSKDVVEQTKRSSSELTIDHKFPGIRWLEGYGDMDRADMTDAEIRARFQLLKRSNGSASHNHLKSRACEHCVKTGNRGTPFGIRFFYHGGPKWEAEPHDEAGCRGCGWYDFDVWRRELNTFIRRG